MIEFKASIPPSSLTPLSSFIHRLFHPTTPPYFPSSLLQTSTPFFLFHFYFLFHATFYSFHLSCLPCSPLYSSLVSLVYTPQVFQLSFLPSIQNTLKNFLILLLFFSLSLLLLLIPHLPFFTESKLFFYPPNFSSSSSHHASTFRIITKVLEKGLYRGTSTCPPIPTTQV